MGTSLTFFGGVIGTRDRFRLRTCRDPICRIHVRRLVVQLDHVRSKLSDLENCMPDSVIRYIELIIAHFPLIDLVRQLRSLLSS